MPGNNNHNKVIPMCKAYDIKKEEGKNLFGKRLREARQKKGWSIKTLTEKLSDCNIHIQSSSVNRWELGVSVPNVYQLFALCRLLDIEDGIRYFSGPLRPGENALNEDGLRKVEEYKKDLIDTGNYTCDDKMEYFDEIEKILRPRYILPASAGTGSFLDGDDYVMEEFDPSTVPPKADFALTISGDSMLPNYTDGQMVWVQKTSELNNNEIGIFVLNGNAYIKMYKEGTPNEDEIEDYRSSNGTIHPKVILISLNKKYAPIEVGTYDDLRILGRVLTK